MSFAFAQELANACYMSWNKWEWGFVSSKVFAGPLSFLICWIQPMLGLPVFMASQKRMGTIEALAKHIPYSHTWCGTRKAGVG